MVRNLFVAIVFALALAVATLSPIQATAVRGMQDYSVNWSSATPTPTPTVK